MQGTLIQVGSKIFDLTHCQTDLNFPRPEGTSGGTIVRVYLGGGQQLNVSVNGMPANVAENVPMFWDFQGQEAITIRRYCKKLVDTSAITLLVEEEVETPAAGRGRTASAKS